MQYALSYNAELHIIELQLNGELTLAEVREAAAAAATLAKEKGCDMLLSDARQARTRMNSFEIHALPTMVDEIFTAEGIDVHRFRRALVAQADLEDYKFFETVALNRGQPLKLFTDIDEARRWLVGPYPDKAAPKA